MSDTKVITNNHEREIKYIWSMSDSEVKQVKKEFDWIDDSSTVSWDEEGFIYYRDNWYCLSDFMSLHNKIYCPNPPEFMRGWDGYLSDSFFSGVLIKLLDSDLCIMGWYYS